MKRLLLILLFAFSLQVNAQVPGTLSYQGILTDASGNPVADGTSVITFNFYTVATGGTAIAGTTRGPINVTTSKGLFTTVIGDGTTNNAALPGTLFNSEFWIGITIGVGGTELVPRVRMTAVPYAYRAQVANTLDAAAAIVGSQITDGTVSTTDLADGGVTTPKLAAGSVTSAAIADATIATADVADGAITNAKLAVGIDASKLTTGTLSLTGTDASKLATGTTAQRPASPVEGQVRYNSTEKVMEYYNGTDWYFVSPKIAFLKDYKSPGSLGGAVTIGIWQTRDLNAVEGATFVTLSANRFTLPPGEYIIEATAPSFGVGDNKSRLFNVTASSVVMIGSNAYSDTATSGSDTDLATAVSLSTTTTFEIQHISNLSRALNGLGTGAGFSSTQELYTRVKISKLR